MLMQLALGGGLLGALLLAVLLLVKVSKGRGRAEGKLESTKDLIEVQNRANEVVNKQNEVAAEHNAEVVKKVEETHEIHDRLNTDPEFAKRVRDRFTRPD